MTKFDLSIKQFAKKIAAQLDSQDKSGKNNSIDADTWKKFAVAKYGAKDNVTTRISIFNAEKSIAYYLRREAKNGGNINDIGEKWFNMLIEPEEESKFDKSLKVYGNSAVTGDILEENTYEKADVTKVDKTNLLMAQQLDKTTRSICTSTKDLSKDYIVDNMYKKWKGSFVNSNLGRDFYEKLYDVIDILHCEIDKKDFKAENYNGSIKAQTMDEVIAILACESSLNSKSRNYIYRGIFQLDENSLKTVKFFAKKYNISGIKQNIGIEGFAKISGAEQLNYLIAHVAFGREASGLSQDEKITPSQLWAIIKKPKYGQKGGTLAQQKASAINKVFKVNSIEQKVV